VDQVVVMAEVVLLHVKVAQVPHTLVQIHQEQLVNQVLLTLVVEVEVVQTMHQLQLLAVQVVKVLLL
jgi:hypothetical protein